MGSNLQERMTEESNKKNRKMTRACYIDSACIWDVKYMSRSTEIESRQGEGTHLFQSVDKIIPGRAIRIFNAEQSPSLNFSRVLYHYGQFNLYIQKCTSK